MTETCPFCLQNKLLQDDPLPASQHFFLLDSLHAEMCDAVLIVPYRHCLGPFDFTPEEWADFGMALARAKTRLARWSPDGYSVGWNVGAPAGQTVFHAHCHVIARKAHDKAAGHGIRGLIRDKRR